MSGHRVKPGACHATVRDGMPTGDALTLDADNLWLGVPCAEFSPEAKPGSCVALTLTNTGTGHGAIRGQTRIAYDAVAVNHPPTTQGTRQESWILAS